MVFKLNDSVVSNSNLTITRTTELIDGSDVLVKMVISYNPSDGELIDQGTNTVKIDIEDMVDNQMNQIVETFTLP